jgi:hypothetical protein
MFMDIGAQSLGEQETMEMQMEENRNPPVDSKRLWFALGAGPILWVLHLLASYVLASLPCITPAFNFMVLGLPGIRFVLIVFTLVMALLVFLAGFMGYGIWRSLRREAEEREEDRRPGVTRFHFMAFSGTLLSVLFGATILLTTGPILALHVC